MGISRREFFKQIFSRKTIQRLSPISSSSPIHEVLGLSPKGPTDPEAAGLSLRTFRKKGAADLSFVVGSQDKTTQSAAEVGAGRNESTGE